MALLPLRRLMTLLAPCLCLAGCNVLDLAKPPPQAPAKLMVVVGDTFPPKIMPNAVLPLAVQVVGTGGGLARGVSVRFELADSALTLGVSLLSAGGAGSGQDTLSVVTDSNGAGGVAVRLAGLAGRAVVRISAPSLGVADSVAYYMTSYAMLVGLSPKDTTVSVGTNFAIAVRGLSLGGALTFVAPVFASRDPGVATVTTHGQVHAVAAGTTYVLVSGVRYPDSVAVTVVP